jgi:hypothetical protein
MQRAPVREFGDESQRCGDSGRHEILVAQAFRPAGFYTFRNFAREAQSLTPQRGKLQLKIDGALVVQKREIAEQVVSDALRLGFGIE